MGKSLWRCAGDAGESEGNLGAGGRREAAGEETKDEIVSRVLPSELSSVCESV